MVDGESVQQNQGSAQPSFDNVHASTVAASGDIRSSTALKLIHSPTPDARAAM
jgi:hypothetical protein